MTLALYGHPFSSYTWKVLIALWADDTPFEFRMIDGEHTDHMATLEHHWPFKQFPMLLDNGVPVVEATCIIDHLATHHPGQNEWIPDGDLGRRVRFLDRFFDLRVMDQMTVSVFDAIRPNAERNPPAVARSLEQLRLAYDWLEANLPDGSWAIGETFTLADCAAGPSLLYADWVDPIGDTRPRLAAYRARLLAHPQIARAVDGGRPYRHFFPLGAPDRD